MENSEILKALAEGVFMNATAEVTGDDTVWVDIPGVGSYTLTIKEEK